MSASKKREPHPRRAWAGSARPADPKSTLVAIARGVARKPERYFEHTYAELFARGLESMLQRDDEVSAEVGPLPPALAMPAVSFGEARAAALELLTTPSLEALAAASTPALIVAEGMAAHVGLTLAPALGGAKDAAEVVAITALGARLETDSHGSYTSGVLVVGAGRSRARWNHGGATALRHVVCALDAAEYARATATAAALRRALEADTSGLSAQRRFDWRAWLAFVFPDEPWAAEDVRGAQAAGVRPSPLLLASLADIASVHAWIEAEDGARVPEYALDLASALPAEEAVALFEELLPALLKKPRYGPLLKTPPRLVIEAVGAIAAGATPATGASASGATLASASGASGAVASGASGPPSAPSTAGVAAASALLARYATHPILGPTVLAIFREHPPAAVAFEESVQAEPRSKLRAAVARVTGHVTPEGPIADPSTLPAFLVTRPWRAPKKKTRPPVLEGLPILGLERGFARPLGGALAPSAAPVLEGAARDAWWEAARAEQYFIASREVEVGGRKLALGREDAAAAFALAQGAVMDDLFAWVTWLGLDAVAGFQHDWSGHLAYEGGDVLFAAASALVSPAMALPMARVAAKKNARRAALAWFEAHADVVIAGLLPGALGPLGADRRACESVLLHLAARGHVEVIRRAAEALGPAALASSEALLARDPLHTEAKVPARPSFLRVEALPPLRTSAGGRLDEAHVEAVLDVLSLGAVGEPYAAATRLSEDPSLDRGSFEAFARELFEQWVLGDAPGRHDWMLHALTVFDSDEGTRRLAGFAREQARKSAAKATRACAALAEIGSDLALATLDQIASTTRYAALQRDAAAMLDDAAARRGLDASALADRTLPDLGLVRGVVELGEGLVATIGPTLTLQVRRGEGPWSASFPRAKRGEPEGVTTARERFAALRADLELAATVARRRFELALREERRWTRADFERFVLGHPLAAALARGLVWETLDESGALRAFRVCEDGSLADVHDDAVTLAADAVVWLAHPARGLDAAWGEVFADYGLVQPFEQLGRGGSSHDRASRALEDSGGIAIAPRALVGRLEARGWRRVDRGLATLWALALRRQDGAPCEARWTFSPHVEMAELRYVDVVTSEPLALDGGALLELSDVAYAELRRDVERLRS
ncbi:MAG: DUF4132 domain-containing protein [Myxococcales bacterium]|nr:DUF4132 domain-containing protein [Myxococcales bacterium]